MAIKDWFKRTFNSGIKKELEKSQKIEKEERELQEYISKLKVEPLSLEISPRGFPLCPVCGEEFKDKEEIIKHLKRNKKEFKELSTGFEFNEKSGELDWVMDIDKVRYQIRNFIHKEGLRFINPYIAKGVDPLKGFIERKIQGIKLLGEIQENKYKGWTDGKRSPKIRENPLSPKVRFEILKRDNFTCQYCGKKAPEVELEVDHIEPYSKTKDNSPENLITACKDCNRGKKVEGVL